jgi:hypothetical protein
LLKTKNAFQSQNSIYLLGSLLDYRRWRAARLRRGARKDSTFKSLVAEDVRPVRTVN